MLIITVFFLFLFLLRFQNYGRLNATILKYYISRKVRYYVHVHYKYSVPHFVNPVVVLLYAANAVLDQSGDLRSRRTTVYSEKLSSNVTSHCDMENQVFLAMYYDCLQSPFTSPHYLSVNGSSSITPGETIRSRCFVLRHEVANTPLIMPMALTKYR